MPTKTDQRPSHQEDGDPEPGRTPRPGVRSFVAVSREPARNDDTAAGSDVDLTDDPDINTHGSER